jgi:VCBS repeat-containing protein
MEAEIVDKATGKIETVSQDVIRIDDPSVVKLHVDHEEVSSIERLGNDLVIRLKSGETIRIVDFYGVFPDDQQSDVVFEGHDGRLWGITHDGSFHLYELNDLNDVLGSALAAGSGGTGIGILAPALGLLGGVGVIAAASGGGDGSNDGSGGSGPDRQPPAAPVIALASDTGISASDHVTSDGTVTVSGLETGATWEYSTDGGTTWVAGSGTSFTLAEGTYTGVQVRQSDAAGNVSATASLGAVTVDTSVAAPQVALASDTGASNTDGVTSDGTVTVSGLEPGATWQYSLDGGVTWATGTGTSFELADGSYTGVVVRQTDVAGNVSAPAALGPVTIETGAAGDLTLALVADTGISASDGVTSNGALTVGGLATGASYEYSTDGGLTWTPGTGTGFTLAEGTYSDVQVRQIDLAGNIGGVTSIGAVTVDATIVNLTVGLATDTGASATDRITNDATIVIVNLEAGANWQYSLNGGATWQTGSGNSFELADGTYTNVVVRQADLAGNVSGITSLAPVTVDTSIAALTAGLRSDTGISAADRITNDGTILIGNIEAGATFEYSTNGGVTWTMGSGTSFTLAEGVYANVQVRQTDVAGNVSTVTTLGAVTVDVSAPAALTGTLVSDTGTSPTDRITSNGAITIGSLESGATWQYSTNGGVTWQAGSATGFTLAEGTYSDVRVRQIDVAGNVGPATSLGGITVDVSVSAPTARLSLDTGLSATDGITSNGAVVVTGLETGARAQYSTNGGTTWIDVTGSTFSLGAGTYTGVQVRQIDLAGNISAATSMGTIVVDTTAAAPTIALAADTGTSATDLITSDGTVNVGNLEAGASWQYSLNNGATWVTGTGTSLELAGGTYTVQVRQTDVAGNTSAVASLGPITIETSAGNLSLTLLNDTGASATDGITMDGRLQIAGLQTGATWQYSTNGGVTWTTGNGTTFALGAGTYTDVQVRQIDVAGNIGAATSIGAVTVDLTPPAAINSALANDTGISATDRITSNGAVVISGLEAGARYEYSTNGGTSWTAGTGTGFTLGAGTYNVQVRQIDLAGNMGAVSSLGAVTVDLTAAAPTVALVADTGISATDRITNNANISIGNLETGATWQYSINGGTSWTTGTGTSFQLADGTYANVQVRQIDVAGNVSSAASLATVTIDTTVVAPTLALAADTGVSATDRITNNGTITVAGIESGATWQYSLNGGTTWLTGSGSSFTLASGTYSNIQVRQTDVAGNVSTSTTLAPVTIDTVVLAPTLGLARDTGTSAIDRITSDGTVNVGNLETGASWQYSTNGGATWVNGSGTSFILGQGTYTNVQIRQTDIAGNVSTATSLGAVTVHFPVAVSDTAALNMGTQTSVTRASATNSNVLVVGLLESNIGVDNSTAITVPAGKDGSVQIQVSQSALVSVADAFRLDVIDANGNVVYSAVTQNSLVGSAAGLHVLGLTGTTGLTATVEGLAPGTYRVVVRNDESALARLLDTDGGGVSLQELGQAGVVLGPQNQTLVLDAVQQALGGGVLGSTARGLLQTTLNATTNLGVGGLVGILTTLLNNPVINAPGLLDTVVGAVANTLLSNTLSLLHSTSITTQVTEYDFSNETVSGNAIQGNATGGQDDLGGGATITQINHGGSSIAVAASGNTTIAGDYGVLTIAANGAYSYSAYGNPNSVGRSDVFTYTLSDGVISSTANITVGITGTAVSAGNDNATSGVNWVYNVDNDYYNANSNLTGVVLGTGRYTTTNIVIGANETVSGSVTVSATLALLSNGTLAVQELVGTTWTTVRTVSYSVLAGVLGQVATIDLSTLNLHAGTYRVQATLSGAASIVNVNTDVNVTHLDQFVHSGSTNATGNILTNDQPGSLLTELQIYNRTTGAYVDVDAGHPITVNGTYGALTINSDGSYVYAPYQTQTYFNTAQVDSFTYHLVHPTGQVAQGSLDVTVRPTGAGVAATAMAASTLSVESDTISVENLHVANDDHAVSSSAAAKTAATGFAAFDMLEGQGSLEHVLEGYLNRVHPGGDQTQISALPTASDHAATASIAATPDADPLGYLVVRPDDPAADQWHHNPLI